MKLEQRVLLEVVALLEADRADVTDKRTIVGVCADVVLVVGRVGEDLAAHFARPLVLGTRHGAVQCRRMHRPRRTSSAAVKCSVHVQVFLAGKTSRTAGAREHRLTAAAGRRHLGRPEGRRRRRRAAGVRWRRRQTERAVAGELGVLPLRDVSQPLIQVRLS